MKVSNISKEIIWVDNYWQPNKCQELISKSEKSGYEPATIMTDLGPRVVDRIRNNERVLFKDFELAKDIWLEIYSIVPPQFGNSRAHEINELFRFYRYRPGQEFKKHRDGSFIRNAKEASYYTILIYLNDDFKGGETTFGDIVISPKQGSLLIFNHQLEHAGNPVTEGIKYVLRSDVMYKLME